MNWALGTLQWKWKRKYRPHHFSINHFSSTGYFLPLQFLSLTLTVSSQSSNYVSICISSSRAGKLIPVIIHLLVLTVKISLYSYFSGLCVLVCPVSSSNTGYGWCQEQGRRESIGVLVLLAVIMNKSFIDCRSQFSHLFKIIIDLLSLLPHFLEYIQHSSCP